MRAIALIDGEHHPAVTRDALARLAAEHDVELVLFVGGEEKLGTEALADPVTHFGRDVVVARGHPRDALAQAPPSAEAVFDLSGEPVLHGGRRMGFAAAALARGLEYRAPGLTLAPPAQERLDGAPPTLAVIGTGKRSGKTAVAGHLASLLKARGAAPVIVSMGRGGPAAPQLVRAEERPDLAGLLELARGGAHAASDYLEDAVLTGVTAIGCRRCGEGPAGEVFDSNVLDGMRLAVSLRPDAIVLEGSGAALPPVAAHRTICVVRAQTAAADALSDLGPLRLLRSELVLLVGTEVLDPSERSDLLRRVESWAGGPVVCCELVPEPAEPVAAGTRAAVFTTAPPEREPALVETLSAAGIEVALCSANLARREALEADLDRAAATGAELYLTELKAAAIDVVAERAEREGVRVAFLRNRVRAARGEDLDGRDLDGALWALFEAARREAADLAGVAGL